MSLEYEEKPSETDSIKSMDQRWRGKRFVYKPISHEEIAEVFDQVKRCGLDQHIKESNVENLAAPTGVRAKNFRCGQARQSTAANPRQ